MSQVDERMESFDKGTKSRGCNRGICCLAVSPICLLFSALCLAGALVILFLFPPFLSSFATKQAKQKVTIVPGHSSYDQLKDPSLPIYLDAYFFNLTNYDNFSRGIEPPKVTEIGPYSFREVRLKYYNESSLDENSTQLTYTQLKTFHFNEETSGEGLSEDDTVCTVNLAMVGAIAQVLKIDNFVERELAIAILKKIFSDTNAKFHICQPAVDLIFNYSDPLVKELHTNTFLKLAKMNLPTDHISIQLNASVEDSRPSIIYTGVDDVSKVAQFYQWNGNTSLSLWFDEYANMINGTEGMLFKPNLKEGEELVAFVDNTYRSFPLINTGKMKIKGLETFRYELPMSVFESAFTNPNNSRWGSWCPDGMFYIGVAQKPAAPVFASKPRFLDVDPRDTSEKIHLPPKDRAKHDTFLYVHPLIGSTLQFQRSLQINLQVNYTTKFKQLEHINGTMYFPIFYVTEHSELTNSFKSYIMKQGLQELEIAKYSADSLMGVLFFCVVVFLLCTVCGVFCGAKHCKRSQYIRLSGSNKD